jgi:hypothetical protein
MTTNLDALITAILEVGDRQEIRKEIIRYLHYRDATIFTPLEVDQFTELFAQHTRIMQVAAQAFDVMTAEKVAA